MTCQRSGTRTRPSGVWASLMAWTAVSSHAGLYCLRCSTSATAAGRRPSSPHGPSRWKQQLTKRRARPLVSRSPSQAVAPSFSLMGRCSMRCFTHPMHLSVAGPRMCSRAEPFWSTFGSTARHQERWTHRFPRCLHGLSMASSLRFWSAVKRRHVSSGLRLVRACLSRVMLMCGSASSCRLQSCPHYNSNAAMTSVEGHRLS